MKESTPNYFDNKDLGNIGMVKLTEEIINEIFFLQSGNTAESSHFGFTSNSGVDEHLRSIKDLIDFMIEISYQFEDEEIIQLHRHLLFIHSLKDHFRKFQLPINERIKVVNQHAEKFGLPKVDEHYFTDHK